MRREEGSSFKDALKFDFRECPGSGEWARNLWQRLLHEALPGQRSLGAAMPVLPVDSSPACPARGGPGAAETLTQARRASLSEELGETLEIGSCGVPSLQH